MFRRIKLSLFCFLCVSAFCYSMYLIGSNNPKAVSVSSRAKKTVYTVIIDAGHGGEDGGAVSADGTSEAGINLAIAQKLDDMLKCMGVKTVMTRTGDDSVHGTDAKTTREKKVSDIHNRMAVMENTENALFVSVHQNFYNDSSLWGTQVFYSVNNSESEILAKNIQTNTVTLLQPENKRMIKKSGSSIYLLYNAEKPAVLVECGFLSNPNETNKLKDEVYQSQIAFAVMCGILDYLSEKEV